MRLAPRREVVFSRDSIRLLAIVLVLLAIAWLVYDVHWHYHMEGLCLRGKLAVQIDCRDHWHYMPYIFSGFVLLFAAGVFNEKAAKGAANIVLPFYDGLMERLGRRSTDPVAVTGNHPVAVDPTAAAPVIELPHGDPDAADKSH